LGLTASPSKSLFVLKNIIKEWREINKDTLNRSIRNLYKSKLVSTESNKDGTLTLFLTKEGKRLALAYNIDEMKIQKSNKWDGHWRIIMFDIPERLKKIRESVRYHLKNLEFYEFQKSVFVHPYECEEQIEYLIEFYNVRRYIRVAMANKIDNELHLKKYFQLN